MRLMSGGDVNEYPSVEYSFDKIPGVDIESGDAESTGADTAQRTGVDMDHDAKPTGVKEDTCTYGEPYNAVPQEQGNEIKVYGLGQDPTKAPTWKPSDDPTDIHKTPDPMEDSKSVLQDVQRDYGDAFLSSEMRSLSSSEMRCTHLEAWEKESAPEDIPSYKGKKYEAALTQVVMALQGSKNAMSLAKMSVKLMPNGVHRNPDTVGTSMVQLSMKASTKGLGAMTHKVDLYKLRHWHKLSRSNRCLNHTSLLSRREMTAPRKM